MRVKVGGFVESSLIDVLGHPAFVIWFSGCNFRCPWCFNGPLVRGEGRYVDVSELVELVARSKKLVDFVQATGGEPTLQYQALRELFIEVKRLGLRTSLDTNCSMPQVVEELIDEGLVDHLALDLKTDLVADKYERVVGVKDGLIVENVVRCIKAAGRAPLLEVRTTYVPSLVSPEDVVSATKKLKGLIPRDDVRFVLQQFYPYETLLDPKYMRERVVRVEELIGIAREVKKSAGIEEVYVRSKRGVLKI